MTSERPDDHRRDVTDSLQESVAHYRRELARLEGLLVRVEQARDLPWYDERDAAIDAVLADWKNADGV